MSRAAESKPKAEYPPKLSLFWSAPLAFAYATFIVGLYLYLSGEAPLPAVMLPIPVAALFISTYCFPPDQKQFTPKQKQRLYFTREVFFSLPVLVANYQMVMGNWEPSSSAKVFLFLLNGIGALHFIGKEFRKHKKEKKDDPLGLGV